MAGEPFQLITVTRCLAEGARLAEVLGCPEISALANTERAALAGLRLKARAVLEDPEQTPARLLHRRRPVATASLDEIELTLTPPKRSADWHEPVNLRLPFVRWAEGDLHQAYLPALGALVFASQAAHLPEKVAEHAKLLLVSRGDGLTLRELARLAQVGSLTLGEVQVTVDLKTPRQLAEAGDAEEKEPSMLARLAQELPPLTAEKSVPLPPPVAFEVGAELAQLASALAGEPRRSVLLVGPPGGGKSALVRELARQRGQFGLAGTPFWTTSGARLMSGPVGFGMWQERCQQLCREAARTRCLLHLQSLADLLEVGKASRGEQSVGGFLRPWIARGELTVIAEATPEQLAAIERTEPHLLSVLQQVVVAEPDAARTRAILAQVCAQTAPAVARAPEARLALNRLQLLHQRYATYSANPGRPVRFLKNLLDDLPPEQALTEAVVLENFSRETGLPRVLLNDAVPLDLEATRAWLAQRVIGQPDAVARVLDLLALSKARLARPGKPLASLLFIGPTGTGKTELAKALAEFLFGDVGRLTRFDLNQFNDPFAVQRLMGGLGTGEGLLTAKVREQPFSVLLLDEFEKADPSFFDLLLQILGDGRLTDAAGRVADFCNCVIVMTSNLGAQDFQRGPAGFQRDAGAAGAQEHFTAAVRRFLRPEIFNRLDAVVPFAPLAHDIVLAVARRQLDLAARRDGLRQRDVEVVLDPAAAELLAARGEDARYGARPLRRVLEREVLTPLAEALNENGGDLPLRAQIQVADGRFCVELGARAEELEKAAREATHAESRLVQNAVDWRRRCQQLARSSAVSALEGEAVMLTAIERRLTRERGRPGPLPPRLAHLPRLRKSLEELRALTLRAVELEDLLLAEFQAGQPLNPNDFANLLADLAKRNDRVRLDFFRLLNPRHEEAVIACFGQQPEDTLICARIYRGFAERHGEVVAVDVFLPAKSGRTAKSRLTRESIAKPAQFWADPPPELLGVALHVRGDLLQPRLAGEAGWHEFKRPAGASFCLVECAASPLEKYSPPPGVERQDGLAKQGTKPRRTYDFPAKWITDAQHIGARLSPDNMLPEVAKLIEWNLERRIEEALR